MLKNGSEIMLNRMSAAEILAAKSHELFTSASTLESDFKALRFKWHPDRNSDPQADEVFKHVYEMHEAATKKLDGLHLEWESDGAKFSIDAQEVFFFEIGKMYVNPTVVLFKIDDEHKSLFQVGWNVIHGMEYASAAMQDQFGPMIAAGSWRKWDEHNIIMCRKTKDVYPLRAVLRQFKGKMPVRHVAWIMSRLHNIAAWFDYNKLSHQALSVDTLFVSPQYHSILPLGGWWYGRDYGSRVTAVPAQLKPFYPASLLKGKLAIPATDQTLIKRIGLELLGDVSATGTAIRNRVNNGKEDQIPSAMFEYLVSTSDLPPVRAYARWEEVLIESFGERKFIPLVVDEATLYI